MLIIRDLAEKGFRIDNLSSADDTSLLAQLLETINRNSTSSGDCKIDAHNAGTVLRFLTAYLSMKPGNWTLIGTDRMHQRPITPLVEALNNLGADINYLGTPGFPPLKILGKSLHGGDLEVDGSVSSQFVSALLMVAPTLPEGLTLHLAGKAVSAPYVTMTIRLMKEFGIDIQQEGNTIRIEPGKYISNDITVETDWSSAAFWYETVALSEEAELHLPGLDLQSIQGDVVLPKIFTNLGVHTEVTTLGITLSKRDKIGGTFRYDFRDCPDLAPAVITTCAALGIEGKFQGLKGLNIKESNRITALATELEKIGIILNISEDRDKLDLRACNPGLLDQFTEPVFESYNDHRIAMAFAPLALKLRSLRIANPEVVSKSYPEFWTEMKNVGFEI